MRKINLFPFKPELNIVIAIICCIIAIGCGGGTEGSDNPDSGSGTGGGGSANQYFLNIDINGNGAVTLDPEGGTYDTETVVTLTPAPRADHEFSIWSGADGSDLVNNNNGTWSITMDSEKSVEASFIPNSTASWVLVYHPCYQWYNMGTAIPWDHITHLTLGYMLLEDTGSNVWTIKVPTGFYPGQAAWFAKAADWITQAGHAGVKVTCMLGGAGSNSGANANFWNMATSVNNVAVFAANIKALLEPVDFDGVDLDGEEDLDYDGMLRLTQELRSILPEAIITIPTGFNGSDALGFAPCNEYVDAFMPMSYLPVRQWGGWRVPVPLTPLYAFEANPYSIELILSNWQNAGVPSSKIVMGVGGYGAAWTDSNGDDRAPNAPYVSSTTENPEGENGATHSDNTISQEFVTQTIATHSDLTEGWDNTGKCSYWSAPEPDDLVTVTIGSQQRKLGLLFYETPRSMVEKKNFVNEKSMKGMMFWTLSMMKDTDNTFPNLMVIKP